MNDVKSVKKALTEGREPMKIGYNPTNLGNDFYYIRKSTARIIVKFDTTTRNSDMVAVAPRSDEETMGKFTKIMNSNFDRKIDINPNSY